MTTAPPPCAATTSLHYVMKRFWGTGTSGAVLRLTNSGAVTCALPAAPGLELLDARGRPLPLVIRVSARCVWGCAPAERRLRPLRSLGPGDSAYVAFEKYRCDAGDRGRIAWARLGRLRARIPPQPDLAWCGAGDPGSLVNASPFEPTARAAYGWA